MVVLLNVLFSVIYEGNSRMGLDCIRSYRSLDWYCAIELNEATLGGA